MSGELEKGGGDELDCLRAVDVARKLRISKATVLRLLHEGKLPGFKVGHSWLIRRDELEKHLKKLASKAIESIEHRRKAV